MKKAKAKRLKKKAKAKAAKKTAKIQRKAAEKVVKITSDFVAEARNRFAKKKTTTISLEQLLKPAVPPPGVLPKGTPTIAMDENLSALSSWGNNYFPSAVSEGQLFLGYPYLSELLQRAEYRRMVETIATQMTRKWIKLKSTNDQKDEEDKLKKIEDEMKRLGVREAFQKAAAHDGGMGRGHIYLDMGDRTKPNEITTDLGDGRDKASQGKVTPKNPLRRLKNIEPTWAYPSNYNATDPMDPAWYRPEEWFVMSKRIHASRLLTFIGREVPDMLKPAYSFGGLSLVQMAKPYVDNWLRTRQSVSDIVNAFSVMVLATNMGSTTNPGGNPNLLNRLDLFNVVRDNAGVMAINKDTEEFKNVSAPLGTLDQLQAQTQEHMSAVSGIPLIFLLGISPAGLNASSEGEIRVFYDWINSYQEHLFRPNLTRVLGFIQLSIFGKVDPSITFDFEPLWSLNEKDQSDLKKAEAETDSIDIANGVISPQERRERVIADTNSAYSHINADEIPDLLEEEEDGLGGAEPAKPKPKLPDKKEEDLAQDAKAAVTCTISHVAKTKWRVTYESKDLSGSGYAYGATEQEAKDNFVKGARGSQMQVTWK